MSDQCEKARARALLGRFIAACFADSVAGRQPSVSAPESLAEARSAATALAMPTAPLDRISRAAPTDRNWDESRAALLGHSVRSPCPPYELEYRRGEVFQQAQELADICGFYRAFGLELSGPAAERADHIVPQWEFLSMLALKEAAALYMDNDEGAMACRDGQRQFLNDHAAFWMPAFFHRLGRADNGGCLKFVAALAEQVLDCWCAEFDVALGADWLELRPAEDGDMSISCDSDSTAGMVELGPTLAAAMADGA